MYRPSNVLSRSRDRDIGMDLHTSLFNVRFIYSYFSRLRLREEVDVLQHLCKAAAAEGGPHPNVLAYIDSWEEDEMLFIQTELCELGNLARFLWEYGKVFPRLDEARVWKVFADLSNVSGACCLLSQIWSSLWWHVTDLVCFFAGSPVHS